jgi:hypothetical protein
MEHHETHQATFKSRANVLNLEVAGQELYTKPAMAMENAYAETQRGIERSHTIDAQRSGTTAGT